MDAAGTGPTWSDIATWYDELVSAGSGPHETAVACLLGLVPALQGATVLDLACGQGLATRALAEAGAGRVIGVDSSEAMVGLDRAQREEAKRAAGTPGPAPVPAIPLPGPLPGDRPARPSGPSAPGTA
jgi:SAM-dependent methyltransferase